MPNPPVSPVLDRLNEAMPTLTPALRKVAGYLLRHPLLAATQGMEALAEAADSSPAAVNRLANVLGYQGFTALRAELTATLQAAVSPVAKLRQQLEQNEAGQAAPGLFAFASDNLRAVSQQISATALNGLASRLLAARRVYVLGFGNSSYLAGLAAANLSPYCDAILASAEGGAENAAYKLASAQPDDVVLALSLPRYSRDTVQLAAFAAERGAQVVALTDSPASPLAAVSSLQFYVPSEHPVLSSSSTAMLALIECLLAQVMLRHGTALSLSTALTEGMLDYLYTDLGPGNGRR